MDRYEILKKLGQGGMGEVFLARDVSLERNVALKFLFPRAAADLSANERFHAEAKAAAALYHPNIITVHDIGELDHRPYIAMEYIRGHPLRREMEKGRLPLERILKIMREICDGLQKSHEAGIVHHDIKPENIMIDEHGHVRILDFGLASCKDSLTFSSNAESFGSIAYMSPERCERDEIDERSDIWSLGVLLYEMLTERLPFEGDSEVEIFYSVINEKPKPISDFRHGLTDDIQKLIEKLLAPQKAQRLATVSQLSAELERICVQIASPKSSQKRALIAATVAGAALIAIVVWIAFSGSRADAPPIKHSQLTFDGTAAKPVVSASGERFAYVKGKIGNQQIWSSSLEESSSLLLQSGIKYAASIDWLPDSNKVSMTGRISHDYRPSTYIFTNQDQSREFNSTYFSSWSPDGAYIAQANGNWKGIHISKSIDGQVVCYLDINKDFHYLNSLIWSPDGEHLLFHTVGDSKYTIWTAKIDDSAVDALVSEFYEISSPKWSADGRAIYYFRKVGQTRQLVKLDVKKHGHAASKPQLLLAGLEAGAEFDISSTNKQLFYSREKIYANLWNMSIADSSAGDPVRMTDGTFYDGSPSISPDGQSVAFNRIAGEKSQIYLLSVSGGPLRQVTPSKAIDRNPVWSPDGKEIAFASESENGCHVWVAHAETGSAQPLLESTLSSQSLDLTWAPGSMILYHRPGHRNYYFCNVDTRPQKPLLPKENEGWVFTPRYSPDGQHVAINRSMQFETKDSGLWIVSMQDSSIMLSTRGEIFPLAWSSDGQFIYALSRRKDNFDIVRVSKEGGELQPIVQLPDGAVDVSLDPAAQFIIYSVQHEQSDIWVMENFDPKNELNAPYHQRAPLFQQIAFLDKGMMFYRQKKYQEADQVFQEGLKLQPDNLALLRARSWVQMKECQFGEAIILLKKALHLNPDHLGVISDLSSACFADQQYKTARRFTRQRLKDKFASPLMRQSLLVRLGAIYFIQNSCARAEENLLSALALDSNVVDANRHLAYLYLYQKQFQKADRFALRAFSLDSSFAQKNVLAAVLVLSKMDIARGIDLANKAMDEKPEDWSSLVDHFPYYALPEQTLAEAWLKQADYEKSIHYATQAMEQYPERQESGELLRAARVLKAAKENDSLTEIVADGTKPE